MSSNPKVAFVNRLNMCPEGIAEFVWMPIPELTTIAFPNTVDDAIIAQGQLAANINLILSLFSGLAPVELLLRIGQHNPVLQGALLAALEYIQPAIYDFVILEPTNGETYTGSSLTLSVKVTDGAESVATVWCNVSGESTLLEQVGDDLASYMAVVDMPETPDVTVLFKVTFKDVDSPVQKEITIHTA